MAIPSSFTHSSTHIALFIEVWWPEHPVPCLSCPAFLSLWHWLSENWYSWRRIGPGSESGSGSGSGVTSNCTFYFTTPKWPFLSLKLTTEIWKSLPSSIEDFKSPLVSNFLSYNLVIPVPSTLRQCLQFTNQVNSIYHDVYFREQEKCISRDMIVFIKRKVYFSPTFSYLAPTLDCKHIIKCSLKYIMYK